MISVGNNKKTPKKIMSTLDAFSKLFKSTLTHQTKEEVPSEKGQKPSKQGMISLALGTLKKQPASPSTTAAAGTSSQNQLSTTDEKVATTIHDLIEAMEKKINKEKKTPSSTKTETQRLAEEITHAIDFSTYGFIARAKIQRLAGTPGTFINHLFNEFTRSAKRLIKGKSISKENVVETIAQKLKKDFTTPENTLKSRKELTTAIEGWIGTEEAKKTETLHAKVRGCFAGITASENDITNIQKIVEKFIDDLQKSSPKSPESEAPAEILPSETQQKAPKPAQVTPSGTPPIAVVETSKAPETTPIPVDKKQDNPKPIKIGKKETFNLQESLNKTFGTCLLSPAGASTKDKGILSFEAMAELFNESIDSLVQSIIRNSGFSLDSTFLQKWAHCSDPGFLESYDALTVNTSKELPWTESLDQTIPIWVTLRNFLYFRHKRFLDQKEQLTDPNSDNFKKMKKLLEKILKWLAPIVLERHELSGPTMITFHSLFSKKLAKMQEIEKQASTAPEKP